MPKIELILVHILQSSIAQKLLGACMLMHGEQSYLFSWCMSPNAYTVKTFGLLQPYFGHVSCMPVVYVTHYKLQGMLPIWLKALE